MTYNKGGGKNQKGGGKQNQHKGGKGKDSPSQQKGGQAWPIQGYQAAPMQPPYHKPCPYKDFRLQSGSGNTLGEASPTPVARSPTKTFYFPGDYSQRRQNYPKVATLPIEVTHTTTMRVILVSWGAGENTARTGEDFYTIPTGFPAALREVRMGAVPRGTQNCSNILVVDCLPFVHLQPLTASWKHCGIHATLLSELLDQDELLRVGFTTLKSSLAERANQSRNIAIVCVDIGGWYFSVSMLTLLRHILESKGYIVKADITQPYSDSRCHGYNCRECVVPNDQRQILFARARRIWDSIDCV